MKLSDLFVDPKTTLFYCGVATAWGGVACFVDSGNATLTSVMMLAAMLCWWAGEWRGGSLYKAPAPKE